MREAESVREEAAVGEVSQKWSWEKAVQAGTLRRPARNGWFGVATGGRDEKNELQLLTQRRSGVYSSHLGTHNGNPGLVQVSYPVLLHALGQPV